MSDYSAMLLPKASWKQPEKKKRSKRKHTKRKSIMQPKEDRRCYLSMLLDNDYREYEYLEEHHVLFGNDKWVSDEYGLRVNLRPEYHRTGPLAVHNCKETADLLKHIAQVKFMKEYPELDFTEIVGKNYL